MKQEQQVKRRMLLAFLGALGITALYYIWAYERFPFIYDINDDVAMRNVAAGVITGTPDAHLIYSQYIWGMLLKALYTGIPGFDWYGIMMTGAVALALTAVLYRGLAARRSLFFKAAYVAVVLLLFTFIGLRHLIFFQFTVAAGMAGAGGLFLFATCGSESRFQVAAEECASVFLLLLALCIRPDVFYMAVPMAALLFWWKYGSVEKGKKFFVRLRHWGVPLALLLGVVLIFGVEILAYRDPQWKIFNDYSADRSLLFDFYGIPDYDEMPELYRSLEMSEDEAVNLHRYSLYLVDGLYPGKMHLLAEGARELYLRRTSPWERLVAGIKKFYDSIFTLRMLPTAAFAGIFFLLAWQKHGRDGKRRSLLAALLLLLGMYGLYLAYQGRIVDRVIYAYLLLGVFAFAGIWMQEEENAGSRKLTWQTACMVISTLVCLAVSCFYMTDELESESNSRQNYNLQFLEINRYMAEHRENVYFMTTFSIETYTDNFTARREFDFTNLLSVGGWHSFSPVENEKIEKLGLAGQTMEEAMLTQERVYVISLANVSVDYIDRYFAAKYRENYLGKEEIDVQTFGDVDFVVYDFSLKSRI